MREPDSIEGYLDCLSRVIDISEVAKERLLGEVEDHLRQAAQEAIASGTSRSLAERAAAARFGSVATIADRAALAEGVACGRRRIRRAIVQSLIAATVAILFAISQLVLDLGSVTSVFAIFLIGFCPIVMIYYARLAHWGLAPQPSLEATLDREARAWLNGIRSVRYQLLAVVAFFLV